MCINAVVEEVVVQADDSGDLYTAAFYFFNLSVIMCTLLHAPMINEEVWGRGCTSMFLLDVNLLIDHFLLTKQNLCNQQ